MTFNNKQMHYGQLSSLFIFDYDFRVSMIYTYLERHFLLS